MTSNVGSAAIGGGAAAVGFQLAHDTSGAETAYSHIKERVTEKLKVRHKIISSYW